MCFSRSKPPTTTIVAQTTIVTEMMVPQGPAKTPLVDLLVRVKLLRRLLVLKASAYAERGGSLSVRNCISPNYLLSGGPVSCVAGPGQFFYPFSGKIKGMHIHRANISASVSTSFWPNKKRGLHITSCPYVKWFSTSFA